MTGTALRRTGGGTEPFRMKPKIFVALFFGLLLAALSFSQAAASIGIVVETFRPLGGGFFSWRSGQRSLAISLYQAQKKPDAKKLIDAGRAGLGYAPLSARSMWLVGKGLELQGDIGAARKAMARADRITRRDGAVLLWLADDELRRGKVDASLRRYDLIIRTEPRAQGEVVTRLAAIITAPQGRRHLQPYIRADNSWLPALFSKAVGGLPRAEPVGRLLIERKAKAPDLPELELTYAFLLTRLIAEGNQDIALRLYPLLPRANPAALSDVRAVVNGRPVQGYPPFTWLFADDEAKRANLVGLDGGDGGIELFNSPGTVGVTATKLIAPKPGVRFRWNVHDRSPNLQASAQWIATCLDGRAKGASTRSVELLSETVPLKQNLTMQLPGDCDLVRLEMRMAGGIGRNPASLVVGNMGLVGAKPRD